MAFVAFPIFMGASVLAPELFSLLLGEKWQNSILVFQILMFVALIECVLFFNGSLMMALGKPNWRLKINMLNAFVNIGAFYLVVRWGIEFVALAYVLRTYLLCPIGLHCVKLLVSISYFDYLKGLLRPAICTLAMAALAILIRSTMSSNYSDLHIAIVCVILCVILYLVLSYTFMRDKLVLLWNSAIAIVAK